MLKLGIGKALGLLGIAAVLVVGGVALEYGVPVAMILGGVALGGLTLWVVDV